MRHGYSSDLVAYMQSCGLLLCDEWVLWFLGVGVGCVVWVWCEIVSCCGRGMARVLTQSFSCSGVGLLAATSSQGV